MLPPRSIVAASREDKISALEVFFENNKTFFLDQRRSFVDLYCLYEEKGKVELRLPKSQFSFEFKRIVASRDLIFRSRRAKSLTIFEIYSSIDAQKKLVEQT